MVIKTSKCSNVVINSVSKTYESNKLSSTHKLKITINFINHDGISEIALDNHGNFCDYKNMPQLKRWESNVLSDLVAEYYTSYKLRDANHDKRWELI